MSSFQKNNLNSIRRKITTKNSIKNSTLGIIGRPMKRNLSFFIIVFSYICHMIGNFIKTNVDFQLNDIKSFKRKTKQKHYQKLNICHHRTINDANFEFFCFILLYFG